MSKLFDSDTETETDVKIENTYANNYNNWRRKEELNKLKTKYGEQIIDHSDSSSSSSDDDDDAMHITEETEKDFFKTLASLKSKDPKIYDESVNFFSEVSNASVKKIKKKDQPIFIKDYERNLLLEGSDPITNSDDETNKPSNTLSYIQEQERIKRKLQDALQNIDDTNEDGWGSMFKSRQRTDVELKQDEEDYRQWLKGQKRDVSDEIKKDLKPLKDYWCDSNLDDNEKFLRDYILNKKFLESEDREYIPTYDEIIHDSDDGLSEDERQVEKQEEFEHKYNYRFEEPDEEFIKRYPRTIESSLRRKDEKRKIKRAEVKERKQKEKQQKMEEIKEMQILKKKEIEEKIKKLKEITGNTEIAFDDKDIEEDFDPEAHDRKMQHIFNNEFYQCPEEDQKPEFPNLDEELELENWEKYDSQEDEDTINATHCEDENFNMDCDYDPTAGKTSTNSKGKKKGRKKTKFAEILSEPKPTFNPDDKTYQEYLDEYYKLECEDIIGDVPCRFKYRKVAPNSFGLTVEEILMANDRELNRWCSLKKAVQYRSDHVEKYDIVAFDRKGKNLALKRKLLPSLFKEEVITIPQDTNTEVAKSKDDEHHSLTKGKKKKNVKGTNKTENVISTPQKAAEVNIDEKDAGSLLPTNISTQQSTNTTDNSNTSNIIRNVTNTKGKKKQKSKGWKVECMNVRLGENNPKEAETGRHKKRKTKHDDSSNPKRTKFTKKNNSNELEISDARLKAFGFKPKKFINKLKYGQNKREMRKS